MQNTIGYAGLAILVVLVCCLIAQSFRGKVAGLFNGSAWKIWFLPVALLAYNFSLMKITGAWRADQFLILAVYLTAPTLVLFFYPLASPANRIGSIAPFLVILMLWIPVELKWVFHGWNVGKASYPFVTACAIIYGLITLAVFSEHVISLTWRWQKEDLKYVGKMFLKLFIIVVPLGLVSGFIKLGINPDAIKHWYIWPLVYVGIWFAPALAEELIFRAGIQNALEKWFGWDVGWVSASMIFGLAHLNNKTRTRKIMPNWEYAFFAAIAGLMYGWVYKKLKARGSRNALGWSAALHATVDFIWVTAFAGE